MCVGALPCQQEAIANLLEGKGVLVSQPTASEKFVIFSPSPNASSIQCCVNESDFTSTLLNSQLPLCSTRSFIGDEKNDESVTRKKGSEMRAVYFMSR